MGAITDAIVKPIEASRNIPIKTYSFLLVSNSSHDKLLINGSGDRLILTGQE